jgi:hypothetical protein
MTDKLSASDVWKHFSYYCVHNDKWQNNCIHFCDGKMISEPCNFDTCLELHNLLRKHAFNVGLRIRECCT